MKEIENKVFFKSSENMSELKNNSIDLVVTSPPYFNIKNYSLDGKQENKISTEKKGDVGRYSNFQTYINKLLKVWKECYRVLKPNSKLCINVPLIPINKKNYSEHHNRLIYDLQSRIQNSILSNTNFQLLDLYIWNRTNSSKKLMFGSYPYPTNFYAQNTIEFIAIFVKPGKPKGCLDKKNKDISKLTIDEWVEYTKQIWNINIPSKNDLAFGKHAAIMPEEIAKRCIKLYSFVNDIILDPFCGSGTTLRVAKKNNRRYVGYELYDAYEEVINEKLKN